MLCLSIRRHYAHRAANADYLLPPEHRASRLQKHHRKSRVLGDRLGICKEKRSIWATVMIWAVAACGSFENKSCYSMFGPILTIGVMLGAVTGGRISDCIGRRWGALSLDMGRLLTGYGIGFISYVAPIFIAKLAPENLRGGLTTLN